MSLSFSPFLSKDETIKKCHFARTSGNPGSNAGQLKLVPIKKLYKLPKNSHIVHPDLGGLNKAQAIKLISIYLQNTSKELKQAVLGKAKLKYA